MDIKRVQTRLLEMGKNIAFILENNNIPYMITFGTLLGAVRHKGFIPWDDDFDLFLFDDTYNKAIEVLKNNLPQDMFVENEETEPKYFHAWAHVKDINTECFYDEFPQDGLYSHHGLSVDLFICKKMKLSELNNYRKNEAKKFCNQLLFKKIINKENYLNKLNKIFLNIEESNSKRKNINGNLDILGFPLSEEYMLLDNVLPLKKYKFEDANFYGPNKSNEILTHFYGDYLTLPPKEKQISHYSNIIFS